MNIQPIETEYNGYKFRSRLEARWAVFFDKAGIPYEYEPEGFVLNGGTYYLPDFYLPWFNCYVEIKPNIKEAIDKGEEKCIQLFRTHGECITMLCVGEPMLDDMRIYCCDTTDSSGGENWFNARFSEGTWWDWHGFTKHHISLIAETGVERNFFTSNWHNAPVYPSFGITSERSDFGYAKTAARQARFEHKY